MTSQSLEGDLNLADIVRIHKIDTLDSISEEKLEATILKNPLLRSLRFALIKWKGEQKILLWENYFHMTFRHLLEARYPGIKWIKSGFITKKYNEDVLYFTDTSLSDTDKHDEPSVYSLNADLFLVRAIEKAFKKNADLTRWFSRNFETVDYARTQ